MKINTSVRNHLFFLDGLRGLAAIYVAAGHARWLLWEGGDHFKAHIHSYGKVYRALAVAMSFLKYGHEMVLFFFVLSGFVIHLKYSKQIKEGNTILDKRKYFIRRATRILPPYLFAFLVTFICDSIVAHYRFSIYTHTTQIPGLNKNIVFNHSWLSLIGNLFFLQTAYVPVFGSNGSIWSLKYEWYFYMLYPILFFFNKKTVPLTLAGVFLIFVVYVLGFQTHFILLDQIAPAVLSWWTGAFIADIYNERIHLNTLIRRIIYACTLLLLLVPVLHDYKMNASLKDQIAAVGFGGLLLFLLDFRTNRWIQYVGKLKWLGDCSYTLYLIHAPIIILMNGILLTYTNNILPATFMYVLIAVILVTVLAYGIHFLVEKPFTSYKKIK
ncbi:MAG: acyltransferase [Arachidicoccus sp.]|nr:acyltransferase [Arachidicoccus sp.]